MRGRAGAQLSLGRAMATTTHHFPVHENGALTSFPDKIPARMIRCPAYVFLQWSVKRLGMQRVALELSILIPAQSPCLSFIWPPHHIRE